MRRKSLLGLYEHILCPMHTGRDVVSVIQDEREDEKAIRRKKETLERIKSKTETKKQEDKMLQL